MNKIVIYSFLAMNLVISTKQCFAAGWFSGWFETTEQKLARNILEKNNTPLLNIMEEQRSLIKTKSQKPVQTTRRQNALQVDILASAIKENSSQKECVTGKLRGQDGRRKIEKTDEWPNSVHGTVFMKFPSTKPNSSNWGTGTLIAPNLVLTAAHNLYDNEKKEEVVEVRFCPAINGKKLPFGEPKIISYYLPEGYKTSPEDDYSLDYGLLVLDQSIGQETGYFGLGIISEADLKTKIINITGYPGDKINVPYYEMWSMGGPIKESQNGIIKYEIDTYGGQSGSGVWYREGEDDYFVTGVHVAGDKHFGINYAVLLTRARYDQITSWIKDSILKGIAQNIFGELFTNVKEIDLGNKFIGDEGAKLFTSNRFPCLTRLDLRNNQIRSEGAQTLAQNTTLTQLDLSDNIIGDIGAQALAQNATLAQLDLSLNRIGDIGVQALAQNTTLTQLNLRRQARNTTLTQLNLRLQGRNTTLTQLNLSLNTIRDISAQALAQNTTLTQLDLSDNRIRDIGAQALAQNTTLTQLDLSDNRIGDIGAQALAQNTTLTQLNLRGNYDISNAGIKALHANRKITVNTEDPQFSCLIQ